MTLTLLFLMGAERRLVQKSFQGEIYQDSYPDECSGSGAICGDDLSDGKRDYHVPACVCLSSHQRRDGNSQTGPYGCQLLGIRADGFPPGTPLGHDTGTVPADVRGGQEFQNPPYRSPDCRCFYCGLRLVCICRVTACMHLWQEIWRLICFCGHSLCSWITTSPRYLFT